MQQVQGRNSTTHEVHRAGLVAVGVRTTTHPAHGPAAAAVDPVQENNVLTSTPVRCSPIRITPRIFRCICRC